MSNEERVENNSITVAYGAGSICVDPSLLNKAKPVAVFKVDKKELFNLVKRANQLSKEKKTYSELIAEQLPSMSPNLIAVLAAEGIKAILEEFVNFMEIPVMVLLNNIMRHTISNHLESELADLNCKNCEDKDCPAAGKDITKEFREILSKEETGSIVVEKLKESCMRDGKDKNNG